MTKILTIIFLFSFCVNNKGQELIFGKSFDFVISKRKFATAIVSVLDRKSKMVLSVGTGTITNRGILTNRHVIENYISDSEKYQIVLEFYNGDFNYQAKIDKCTNRNEKDLCLLSINEKPAHYFKIVPFTIRQNKEIAKIGNCNEREFHAEKGRLDIATPGLTTVSANGEEELDILAITGIFKDCTSGSSGGPVFDREGKLIAITVAASEKVNRHYYISIFDVIEFLDGKEKADLERRKYRKYIEYLTNSKYSIQEETKKETTDKSREKVTLPSYIQNLYENAQ